MGPGDCEPQHGHLVLFRCSNVRVRARLREQPQPYCACLNCCRIGLDSSSSLTHFVRMSPRRSTHRRLDTEQQVQTVRKKSSPAEVMRHKKMRELIEVARARVPQKVDRRKPLIFIRSFGRAEKGLTTPDLLERMVPKTWLRLCGLQPHLPSVPDGEVPPSRQKPMVGGQHSGGTGWGQYRGAFHRLDCTTRSACRPA